MRIYRETIGSTEKKTLLYSNGTQDNWNNLIKRSMEKAVVGVGFGLPRFYPESRFAFSVELRTGKKFRFNRVDK